MKEWMRTLVLVQASVVATFVAGQCPGIRPQFSWASSDSAIIFTDLTEVQFPSERLWEFGDGQTASGEVETHGYAFAGDDTVRLTLVVNGCTFSVSGRVVHPGVNDNCDSQITSAFNEEQIGNNEIAFTDASTGDGSFLLHLWTFGDDSISIAPNDTHFYVLPGAYDVSHSIGTLDSLFQTACVAGSARRVFVDGNTSTCDSSLFLDLSVQTFDNYATLNAQVVLFNTDLQISLWQWDYGDGSPIDETLLASANHYYPYGGEVQVCVQVWAEDTTDESTCFARNCTTLSMNQLVGLAERDRSADLRTRPVPFTDELWIEGEAVRAGTAWRLVDAMGREALSGWCAQNGRMRVDGATLIPGIYTVIVLGKDDHRSIRVLKQ